MNHWASKPHLFQLRHSGKLLNTGYKIQKNTRIHHRCTAKTLNELFIVTWTKTACAGVLTYMYKISNIMAYI